MSEENENPRETAGNLQPPAGTEPVSAPQHAASEAMPAVPAVPQTAPEQPPAQPAQPALDIAQPSSPSADPVLPAGSAHAPVRTAPAAAQSIPASGAPMPPTGAPVPPTGEPAVPPTQSAVGSAGAPVPPAPQPYVTFNAAAPVPSEPAPRKSRAWIVALAVVVALCIVAVFGIASCSSVVESATGSAGATAIVSDSVAVIDIDGTIQYDGTACSPEGLKSLLDEVAAEDNIVGVVLRVNSGGGTATAGEEMATYVKQFREDTGKPVVVSCASTNCSAAYEISSQADYIFTAKTSAVGAIGTVMQTVDYSKLMEMLGISVDNITSAESKDSSYSTRALTEEERAYYQDQVNQINEVFIQNVADGRNMSVDAVRELATGMQFTGMQAVENGLADEIGTEEDAVAYAAQLAGVSDYETVYPQQSAEVDYAALLDLLSENDDISVSDVASALKELESNGTVAR